MLSKSEKKYRTKIIQEWHLKKKEQMFLDEYKAKNKVLYKEIYSDFLASQYPVFMLNNCAINLGLAMKSMGTTAASIAESIKSFSKLSNNSNCFCFSSDDIWKKLVATFVVQN